MFTNPDGKCIRFDGDSSKPYLLGSEQAPSSRSVQATYPLNPEASSVLTSPFVSSLGQASFNQ